jgi:tetratricopeptide (TPR) repeat protein
MSPTHKPMNNRDWAVRVRAHLRLRLLAGLIACVAGAICLAQNSTSDRAAEWKKLALPTAEFARLVDEDHGVVARVPATWKAEPIARQGAEHSYRFTGPYATVLQISIEKVPSGLPLQSYTAQILQQLRDLPGGGDSLLVRQVEMSGLDAREIMFEVPDENGMQTRRLIWCAVDGPVAVGIVFIESESHIAEIEPYLRAVVQSVMIGDKERGFGLDLLGFEATRTAAIKASKPARVDEVQTIAERINGLDASARAASVDKLAALFATVPDVCVDLVLDRRPIVRAATVEAIAKSKSRALDPILRKALHDQESFVAERAARALAGLPNALVVLREETLNWFNTQLLSRVWPFLDKNTQLQILTEGFTSITTSRRGTLKPLVKIDYSDPSVQLGLLTLMVDIPAQDFKLPATVLKTQSETLTAAALQVALMRREALPFDELFKLLSSGDKVRLLAARNLGESATMANLGQLEEFAKVLSGKTAGSVGAASTDKPKTGENSGQFANELQLTIRKIRLRNNLNTATPEQRARLIADAAKDPGLTEWVWLRYINAETQASDSRKIPNTATLSSFGENAFPKQMTHFVSVPNPATAVEKLGASLNNIQMDSARAQANMVLMLTGISRLLGEQLGAPADGPLLDYSGIKPNAPISFGSWIARGAPLGIDGAQRKAVILHVSDRDRFERSLGFVQEKIGSLASFPNGAAVGARFFALLPAIFPLSANMLSQDAPPSQNTVILKCDFLGQSEVDGYPVRRLVANKVSTQGAIYHETAYVAYLGDAAVVTPDLASMHDVLQRIVTGDATLEQNQEFKAARENGGEAFYFSNLTELFSPPGNKDDFQANEFGALKISNQTWDSSYHLTFSDDSWSRLFVSFSPEELSAPRELLPRSTVLYSFMKMNGAELLRTWRKVATPAELKGLSDAFAADLEKEVIPEIESECGAAFLDLPDLSNDSWAGHWVLFVKLKSDRLQRALAEGKLFTGASVNQGTTTIKLGSSSAYVAIKNGFLVISDSPQSLTLLDQPQKLAASSDFKKGVARTPAKVVAFGGYNLEATNSVADAGADSVKAQQANMILSVARAFHSPSIYATLNGKSLDAHSTISMDREGRYSVAELQGLAAKAEPTFAILRPGGMVITDQNHLNSLRLRIKSKAAGEMERIAEDLSSKSQTVEKRSERELQLQILPRRAEPRERLQLPISAAGVAEFLTPSKEIPANDKSVANKAREIAGTDRDAWSVARKLADWTFKNLKWKRVDYANAAQTLATREADCYEFSKFYVAMARSLGLPARVVSGMAYSDGSFGGHAWVEVYIGDWIEIDPTWGTSYVDATHIKDSNGALLTYAVLNLVQLEVLETPHSVADYQKDPAALTKEICRQLSQGSVEALRAASDVAAVTDELMGPGAWTAMTDKERDQMSGAYTRVLTTLTRRLSGDNSRPRPRLLKLQVAGDRAEARVMSTIGFEDDYLKLTLVKRGTAWTIAEVTEIDSGLKMIAENLQPTLNEIRDRRSGKPNGPGTQTDFARVIIAMQRNNQKDALALADKLLKDNPKSQGLRFLRSLCLAADDGAPEAAKIWAELVREDPPVVPALRKLAAFYARSKDATENKQAVELYQRYIMLEPGDPRARQALAALYEGAGNSAAAETEYRAALEFDQTNGVRYVDLAEFYAEHKRFAEVGSLLKDAEQRVTDKDDLFADLISRFWFSDKIDVPEELAASQPQRMAHSSEANLYLARIRIANKHPREAFPLLKKAAALDTKSPYPYDLMAEAFRNLREWAAALNAADSAIRLNGEDADAYYHRACALARLGRRVDAITALKRAVELDEEYADELAEEEDLKSLTALPEFKKLLPKSPQP